MMDKQAFQAQFDEYRRAIEDTLKALFTDKDPWGDLYESMRYSLLAGGKRIRPVMVLAFARAAGLADWRRALPAACAVELVHTYSLIHDDLPCMDDDDLRRGKPTCHKVYGEAMAVLAGDALQAEAFRLLATAPGVDDRQRSEAVAVLARSCGADGMVAGQTLDILGPSRSRGELERLHSLKTGAMIQGAAELGCVAAGADSRRREQAAEYARHIGLAFQVRDDILDVIADQQELGKTVGSDRRDGKTTFVDLLGLEDCEALVAQETARAKAAISDLPGCEFLLNLAERLADRRS